jgi:ATP-dependent Lon protease
MGRKKNTVILEKTEKNNEIIKKIQDKLHFFRELAQKTFISVNIYKNKDLFSHNDCNMCISQLTEIEKSISKIEENMKKDTTTENGEHLVPYIDDLQNINNRFSTVHSQYGTHEFADLLRISLGNSKMEEENPFLQSKFDLLVRFFRPVGFKTIKYKKNKQPDQEYNTKLCSEKIVDSILLYENENHLECFEIEYNALNQFHNKMYGIQVFISSPQQQKSMLVRGYMENISLDFLYKNGYVKTRIENLRKKGGLYSENDVLQNYIGSLLLKDVLIYGDEDFLHKIQTVVKTAHTVEKQNIKTTIQQFMDGDLYSQRTMLNSLLIYAKNDTIKYTSYILYDLLTSSGNNQKNMDTVEQRQLFDSLSIKMQDNFKEAMRYTVQYTNDMTNNQEKAKLSIEQQIYFMKATEQVKEKAIQKYRETRGKNDDTNAKTRQYLEALLRIPFGIYKKEPILNIMKNINTEFINVLHCFRHHNTENNIDWGNPLLFDDGKKRKFAIIEIINHMNYLFSMENTLYNEMNKLWLDKCNAKQRQQIAQYIQKDVSKKLAQTDFKTELSLIDNSEENREIYDIIFRNDKYINKNIAKYMANAKYTLPNLYSQCSLVNSQVKSIETQMQKITDILDKSIYGHTTAKNSILKIICQWMTGEQTGYCFGFEGAPGVGKTSLAKYGIANCLQDENNISRPFSFIALGGSANGSTLEGHNYTYVNSTWGRISEILMETKCMNPIIYVDELDKVSKTEHGKEIIGVLTHLIDSTQNDNFQDKYFTGIPLDLSKALFIFSYNDPEQIDRILLDRIHRIKFENLSLKEKIVIVKSHILPDINKKMGFSNIVELSDEIIEHIIDCYTLEPGVRKLKEIMFDLFGEINIEILKMSNQTNQVALSFVITKTDLEGKYLKTYTKVNEKKIHKQPSVGIINALWANSLGKGGIITLESIFFPTSTFLEFKLTGLQGNVMQESMNVAKNLAWNLTPLERQKQLLAQFKETSRKGIHVHCSDNSISKDGPSAGIAITVLIYSMLNELKIRNDIAMTGEIDLHGNITAIGGLQHKIIGGIRAGVKSFIYPKENKIDFDNFVDKNENWSIIRNIVFLEVTHILEVIDLVFV